MNAMIGRVYSILRTASATYKATPIIGLPINNIHRSCHAMAFSEKVKPYCKYYEDKESMDYVLEDRSEKIINDKTLWKKIQFVTEHDKKTHEISACKLTFNLEEQPYRDNVIHYIQCQGYHVHPIDDDILIISDLEMPGRCVSNVYEGFSL